MKKQLYSIATTVQNAIRSEEKIENCERILLDTWATILQWNIAGENIWRITDEQADALMTTPLPPDLQLASAFPERRAAAYQLPNRKQWIVIARHSAKHPIPVYKDLLYSFPEPVITYVTEIDSQLSAGYYNLTDMPTPADLILHQGYSLGPKSARRLSEIETLEEDWRVSLALLAFYQQA